MLLSGDFALPIFKPLLEDAVFKVAYGGRASAKSWFFADLHLHTAMTKPGYRALCLRQVQKSIRESLKFLLEERIQYWGLADDFRVLESRIEAPGGGEFVFHGLEGVTAESVKSFEGFDVADIEEGQMIKQRPWELLVPTIIRKEGAQIWARWNPRHDTDTIDAYFRGANPPKSSIIVECSYKDNPYVQDNKLMMQQIDEDYARDPEKAEHIWGGGYELITEAAYYGKEMVRVVKEGRFTSDADWQRQFPVTASWDIGMDDYTAVWFWQFFKNRVHLIDYYEVNNLSLQDIAVDLLKEHKFAHADTKRYEYEENIFPHDIRVRDFSAGGLKRIQIARQLGFPNVRAGSRLGPEERVAATRALLPICYFAKNKRVEFGMKRLRNYQRKYIEAMGTYGGPKKDGNDHGADSFGEGALNCPVTPKEVLGKVTIPKKDTMDDYREHTQGEIETWL